MVRMIIFDLDSTLAPIGLGMGEEELKDVKEVIRVDKNCKSTLEMLKYLVECMKKRNTESAN